MVDQFEEIPKVSEQKMTSLCGDEKATQNKTDEETDYFQNMTDEVDKLKNRKVRAMTN